MKKILEKLFLNNKLSTSEAKDVLIEISKGKYNATQVAAFMTVYNMRPISVEELYGFQEALLELCIPLDTQGQQTIDNCGTGGDGKNTFNVSTLSAFVIAAAGYKVTKHGNYGVSSKCGSSNVLEALGYQFTNDTDVLQRQLEQTNLCFMHAPHFHPALKGVGSIRKDYGIKTFFNMLGPLVNPAKPTHQSTGVYSLSLARLYKYVQEMNNRQFIVMHTLDGYDEISLTGSVKIYNNQQEVVLSPQEMGFEVVNPSDISGGETIEDAKSIFLKVLKNEGTAAQKNVVLANAAMGIQCFDFNKSFADCVAEANEALESGKAFQTLQDITSINSLSAV